MTYPGASELEDWTLDEVFSRTKMLLDRGEDEVLVAQIGAFAELDYLIYGSTQIAALLHYDRPDLVDVYAAVHTEYSAEKLIGWWAQEHFGYMVEHCPSTYTRWENKDYARTVVKMSRFFYDFTAKHRESLLREGGKTAMERRLCELLRLDPSLWTALEPSWIGQPHSTLRQVAIGTGWHHSAMPNLMNTFGPEWGVAFAYPRSLYALTKLGAYVQSRGMNSENLFVPFPGNNDPVDLALANALVRHQGLEHKWLFAASPWMASVDDATQTRLNHLVESYASLGCLDLLAQSLAMDVLPGGLPKEHLDLPPLDGPQA